MLNPSQNPVSSAQSLPEIAAIFIEADHSKTKGQSTGRLYLVIDPKSQQVSTITDQKLASSVETIALFVHQLNLRFLKNPTDSMFYKTGHIRNQEGEKINLPRLLKNELKEINTISAKLGSEFIEEKKQGSRIRNAASYVFGGELYRVQQGRIDFARGYRKVLEKMGDIEEGEKKTQKELKQKPVSMANAEGKEREELDYGQRQVVIQKGEEDPIVVVKSNTYEGYAAKKRGAELDKKAAANVNFFSDLAAKPQLSRSNVEAAFKRELSKQTINKPVIEFVSESFNSVLDQWASQVEKGKFTPEEANQRFVKDLKNHMADHNTNVLQLDKETFELLVLGRSNSPLPLQNPAFARLRQDYKQGRWIDQKNEKGEVTNPKTVVYETLSTEPYQDSPSEFSDALKDLDQILDQKDFKTIIESFFQQAKPKSSESGPMAPG